MTYAAIALETGKLIKLETSQNPFTLDGNQGPATAIVDVNVQNESVAASDDITALAMMYASVTMPPSFQTLPSANAYSVTQQVASIFGAIKRVRSIPSEVNDTFTAGVWGTTTNNVANSIATCTTLGANWHIVVGVSGPPSGVVTGGGQLESWTTPQLAQYQAFANAKAMYVMQNMPGTVLEVEIANEFENVYNVQGAIGGGNATQFVWCFNNNGSIVTPAITADTTSTGSVRILNVYQSIFSVWATAFMLAARATGKTLELYGPQIDYDVYGGSGIVGDAGIVGSPAYHQNFLNWAVTQPWASYLAGVGTHIYDDPINYRDVGGCQGMTARIRGYWAAAGFQRPMKMQVSEAGTSNILSGPSSDWLGTYTINEDNTAAVWMAAMLRVGLKAGWTDISLNSITDENGNLQSADITQPSNFWDAGTTGLGGGYDNGVTNPAQWLASYFFPKPAMGTVYLANKMQGQKRRFLTIVGGAGQIDGFAGMSGSAMSVLLYNYAPNKVYKLTESSGARSVTPVFANPTLSGAKTVTHYVVDATRGNLAYLLAQSVAPTISNTLPQVVETYGVTCTPGTPLVLTKTVMLPKSVHFWIVQ